MYTLTMRAAATRKDVARAAAGALSAASRS